jgi:hypothetical protein
VRICAWLGEQAEGFERDVLNTLARGAESDGRRGWRTALLDLLGTVEPDEDQEAATRWSAAAHRFCASR